MSAPHDFHPDAVEDDPTGIRALLSSLPDPGPMPEDLVARITASLSAAQAAPVIDDLMARRERRNRRPLLVAAAAVVVVAGGGVLLSNGLPRTLLASAGAGSAESAASPVAVAGGADPSLGAQAQRDLATDTTVVIRSGNRYAAGSLATTAGWLLRATPGATPGATRPAGIDGSGDPESLTTLTGARACAAALGIPAGVRVIVDVATVDGSPGAVVVSRNGAGGTAYAVGMACGKGTTDLIAGPVPMPRS